MALAVLGLEEGAGEEETKTTYRRLVREAHPDTGEKPDAVRLQELGEARDVMLEPASGQALATREDVAMMLRTQNELARVSRESEATVDRVVMQHVGKLSAARNRRLTMGGLGAVIGILMTAVTALGRVELGAQGQGTLLVVGGALTVCSLALGALALLSTDREGRLRLQIEDAGETLADRGALTGTLAELGLEGFFTRDDLQEAIYYWSEMDNEVEVIRFRERMPLSRVAAKIGPVDFARLLVAKGLESEMIVEAEEADDENGVRYGYRRT